MSDIAIPKSIQATWDKVSTDKKITKDEFKELVNSANADNDISDDEFKTLNILRNKILDSSSSSVNIKEGEAKGSFSFVEEVKTPAPEIKNTNDIAVPKSMQKVWKEVSTDKNINKEEFNQLLNEANSDDDISKDELHMLGKLRTKILVSDSGSVKIKDGVSKDSFSFDNKVKNSTYSKLFSDLDKTEIPVKKDETKNSGAKKIDKN